MSDPDIQFGEVEQAPPQRRRRPDRDRHFAVADYGTASQGDLAIFVDMDVLADVEAHARTDTSVELGGVLLGGQYVDEDGDAFVVVTDSLRAEHYESSRGHFKFTHDTWTRIGRQREEFSDELQMVGWYHTHPGWGVFLSNMDRFICDHFFNRPLDVALVVDPVGNDRGWFYWQDGATPRLPQTGGFRVTSSRFRRRELAAYVARLEGKMSMKPDAMFGGAPEVSTQVVHVIRPQMGWMAIAILAILVLQACLTLLVALRLGSTGGAGDSQPGTGQVARGEPSEEPQPQADLSEEAGRREFELLLRQERLDAERQLLDSLLGHVRVGPDGRVDIRKLIEENESQQKEIDRLTKADFLLSELTESHKRVKQQLDRSSAQIGELEAAKERLLEANRSLRGELGKVTDSRDEAAAQLEIARAEIDRLKSPDSKAEGEETGETGKQPQPAAEGETEGRMPAWTIAIIVAAALVLTAIAAVILIKRKRLAASQKSEGGPNRDSE
jgi:proteasome lid subunit RPN8/RPN11